MIKYLPIVFMVLVLVGCGPASEEPKMKERVGLTESSIVLGSSSALTGHAGFLGSQYLQGAQLYFDEINKEGGIHGRRIEIIGLDDQYNPTKTIANTQKLINLEKVFALFNYVGTPTSLAVLPIINDAKIPAFGFFTGAEPLRRPVSRYIFHLRDSYYAEAEGAVGYFVDRLGLKNIGVFYQEDAFGITVLKGIQFALKKRGLEPVVTDTYTRGSMDIEDSVEWISREKVDVVMMVGTYSPLAKFISLTHDMGNYPLFSTVSFVGSEAYAKELVEVQRIEPEYYENIVVTQVVPSPYSDRFQTANHYMQLSAKYLPKEDPNYVAFEGFLNAKVIVQALQGAGRDLTRTAFIQELRSIKEYDMGIEKRISYGAGDQEGLSGIYYSRLNVSGRFELFDIE